MSKTTEAGIRGEFAARHAGFRVWLKSVAQFFYCLLTFYFLLRYYQAILKGGQ
jgi:hypothetical protein